MDEYDFSVLAALATFNRYNDMIIETGEINIRPLTIDIIIDTLELRMKKGKKATINKIKKSLKTLCEHGILTIKSKIDSEDLESRYEFSQVIEKEGSYKGYATIHYEDLFKILMNVEKDSDRLKALACYISVSQRFFGKTKLRNEGNFHWLTEYERSLNFETLENIGEKYGKNRRSVLSSLDILINLKVFKLAKVKLKSGNYKYIICRYEESEKMENYIEEKLKLKEYLNLL